LLFEYICVMVVELNEGIEWWNWLSCFNLGCEFGGELKWEIGTELGLICCNNSLKFMLISMPDLLNRINPTLFGYLLWIHGDCNYLTLLRCENFEVGDCLTLSEYHVKCKFSKIDACWVNVHIGYIELLNVRRMLGVMSITGWSLYPKLNWINSRLGNDVHN